MTDLAKHVQCRFKQNRQQRATAVRGPIYRRIELYAVSSQPKGTPTTRFRGNFFIYYYVTITIYTIYTYMIYY